METTPLSINPPVWRRSINEACRIVTTIPTNVTYNSPWHYFTDNQRHCTHFELLIFEPMAAALVTEWFQASTLKSLALLLYLTGLTGVCSKPMALFAQLPIHNRTLLRDNMDMSWWEGE